MVTDINMNDFPTDNTLPGSYSKTIIMKLNYVQISINRTDFVSKHKLLPVNLTWLFQVYGKNS